jgi:aerobic carbon-monoxide dehydrogenase medium subunit
MFAYPFDYYRAGSLDEAVGLLRDVEGAQLLAGGHSLLPAMKLRLSAPAALVDISQISELAGISQAGDQLRIGATTTHAAIAASDLLQDQQPLLAETAAQIGDPQVRNRGTLGGALAHADPGGDYPAALLAAGAAIHVVGPDGQRQIEAADFFLDLFTTALAPGELITAVNLARLPESSGSAYVKQRHPASGYCVVGAAATVTLDGDGRCAAARLAVGGVTAVPLALTTVAEALQGQRPTEANVRQAVAHVPAAIREPFSDQYASAEYRIHLATVLTRRALLTAAARCEKRDFTEIS